MNYAQNRALNLLLDGVVAYNVLLMDLALASPQHGWQDLQSDAGMMASTMQMIDASGLLFDPAAQKLCHDLASSCHMLATASDLVEASQCELADIEHLKRSILHCEQLLDLPVAAS